MKLCAKFHASRCNGTYKSDNGIVSWLLSKGGTFCVLYRVASQLEIDRYKIKLLKDLGPHIPAPETRTNLCSFAQRFM